jgi:hypothetical protein
MDRNHWTLLDLDGSSSSRAKFYWDLLAAPMLENLIVIAS